MTASAMVFWLTLALSAALGRGLASSAPGKVAPSKPAALFPHLLSTVVILTLISFVCLRPLLADVACWQARQREQPIAERLAAAQRAVRLWSREPEYRLWLAWIYLEAGDPAAAEAQLAAATRLNPHAPRVWAVWGQLYALWGEVEPDRYLQAEAAYRRVLDLAPNVAAYHAALGLVLVRKDRLEEGVAELERAVALDATDGVAYRHLAGLYRVLGRETEADWAWREAVRWGDRR